MAYTKQEIKTFAVIAGSGTASGTDTYTVSIPEIEAYATGQQVIIKFTNANTTNSTLNINSLGAKNILKGVTSTLNSGDILANQEVLLAYDGTSFQMLGLPGTVNVSSTANNLFNYYNFR